MCRKQVRDPNLAKEIMDFNGDPGPSSSSRSSRIRNIGGDDEQQHRAIFYNSRLFGVDDVGLY